VALSVPPYAFVALCIIMRRDSFASPLDIQMYIRSLLNLSMCVTHIVDVKVQISCLAPGMKSVIWGGEAVLHTFLICTINVGER
jgi:hypothetical protein